jgi:hypothetical protein
LQITSQLLVEPRVQPQLEPELLLQLPEEQMVAVQYKPLALVCQTLDIDLQLCSEPSTAYKRPLYRRKQFLP